MAYSSEFLEFDFEEFIFKEDVMSVLEYAEDFKNIKFKEAIYRFFKAQNVNDINAYLTEFLVFSNNYRLYSDEEEENALIVISQILRVALIFQATELSNEHIQMMKNTNLKEEIVEQLIVLGTNSQILNLNKQLRLIYRLDSEDILYVVNPEIPFLGPFAIDSILRALTMCHIDGDCPFLTRARNNLGILVPRIIFAGSLAEVVESLRFVAEIFEDDFGSMHLFFLSFAKRFSTTSELLASYFLTTKERNGKGKIIVQNKDAIEDQSLSNVASMSFVVFLNKQKRDLYDNRAEVLMNMVLRMSNFSGVLGRFFHAIDLVRLLYKMKSLYVEFQAQQKRLNNEFSDEAKTRFQRISQTVSKVLLERLHIPPLCPKTVCMLIEHITLWTDSATLMVNLALRWAEVTEYSVHAVIVLDVLIHLIGERPDFLSEPDIDLSQSSFIKQTLLGALFHNNESLFVDLAIELKKRQLKMCGSTPAIVVENNYTIVRKIKETQQLRSFLASMYFHTPASDFREGRLFGSFHNLLKADLPEQPEDLRRSKVIELVSIFLTLKEKKLYITVNKVKSSTKIYADQGSINRSHMERATVAGVVEQKEKEYFSADESKLHQNLLQEKKSRED